MKLAVAASLISIGLSAAALQSSSVAAGEVGQTNPWWDRYHNHARLVALPDGRRMNVLCEGEGSPTVLLESGGGSGAWNWLKVHLAIAKVTRTCAYDRAGYGGSDPGPPPRDVSALVADLEALLAAGEIEPPYVLVGHSLGGLNVRLFASRNPGMVKGLVLVDPGAERQTERLTAVVPDFRDTDERIRECLAYVEAGAPRPGSDRHKRCVPDAPPDMPAASRPFHEAYVKDPRHWRTLLDEYSAYHQLSSAKMEASSRDLRDVPLVVLTADTDFGSQYAEATKVRGKAEWARMHEEQAALSTRGQRMFVPGSAHAIQDSHPQVVIDAVLKQVEAARLSASGRLRR